MKFFYRILLLPVFLLAVPSDDFVITVQTDNTGVSSTTQFRIPITRTTGNGYNVDCDDDGTDEVTGATTAVYPEGYTCSYGSVGTYTVRIKDNNGDSRGFRRVRFYIDSTTQTDVLKILSLEQWGTALWSSMAQAYRGASNLQVNANDIPNLTQVTSLRQMFQECSVADPDVVDWNLTTITNISGMFRDASQANPDVSNWDTSSVTNFSRLFQDAISASPNVSTWNTVSATDMSHLFNGASSANPDVANWNTSNVTTFFSMFRNTDIANPDVSIWNLSSATTLDRMFQNTLVANPYVRNWNTVNVTSVDNMFRDASAFDRSLGSWDIGNLTSAANVFLNTKISVDHYDDTLIRWEQQTVQSAVELSSDATYCQGDTARSNLISNDSWAITDGGIECVPCGNTPMTLTHFQWKIISIPCDTGSNTIDALFGNDLGTYGTGWVMYQQSGTDGFEVNATNTSTDKTRLDASSTVVPGKGYWIIADIGNTGDEKNITIPNTLANLNFTSIMDASSVGINDGNFTKVHEYQLPKNEVSNPATVDSKKYMAGNPFTYAFHLSDLYFKHNVTGEVYNEMGNANNDAYINKIVYKHNSSSTNYEAVDASTPGFAGSIQATEGFFIQIIKNQNDSNVNHFAYPFVID